MRINGAHSLQMIMAIKDFDKNGSVISQVVWWMTTQVCGSGRMITCENILF